MNYVHIPLSLPTKQLRLFILEAASDRNAAIHGSLRVKTLSADNGTTKQKVLRKLRTLNPDMRYEALSYVWGESSGTHQIYIDRLCAHGDA